MRLCTLQYNSRSNRGNFHEAIFRAGVTRNMAPVRVSCVYSGQYGGDSNSTGILNYTISVLITEQVNQQK